MAPFGNQSLEPDPRPLLIQLPLLPIQLSALNSATLDLSNYNTTITSGNTSYWDSNFEFWISKDDPTKTANAGVYAEIIMFLGYEPGRTSSTATPEAGWTCDHSGSAIAGGAKLQPLSPERHLGQQPVALLQLQPQQRGAPQNNFNGTVDVKDDSQLGHEQLRQQQPPPPAACMWLVQHEHAVLTRIEVGTEVDDSTAGSVKISNLTFNINGTSKSIALGH